MFLLSNILYTLQRFSFTDIPYVDIIEEHVAVIGQSVIIAADIESCPPVKYAIWEKMNSSTNEFHRLDMESDKYSGSNINHRHPQLVIKNVSIEDKLLYRLTVCNALGKSNSKNVVLKLVGGKVYTFSHKG